MSYSILERDIKNLEGIRSVLEAEGGAFSSDEQESAFDELSLSVPENLEALGLYCEELDSISEGLKFEVMRLRAKDKALSCSKSRARKLIVKGLLSLGWKNIRSKLFTASLVKSRKVLPKDFDFTLLPEKYLSEETVISVDARTLLRDAKDGLLSDYFELEDSGVGLRIG